MTSEAISYAVAVLKQFDNALDGTGSINKGSITGFGKSPTYRAVTKQALKLLKKEFPEAFETPTS